MKKLGFGAAPRMRTLQRDSFLLNACHLQLLVAGGGRGLMVGRWLLLS
jgi:hypothetical protein